MKRKSSSLSKIKKSIFPDLPIIEADHHLRIQSTTKQLSNVFFRFKPSKIIFPLREGELIENPHGISIGEEYSLTYPGTASTKCVVIYQKEFNLFWGGRPSYEYTKIVLTRLDDETFQLAFLSREHDYLLIPFENDWKTAADHYKKCLDIDSQTGQKRLPKYLLQLGVKDSDKKVHINNFSELTPVIELFYNHFGAGNIIHFFGTNKNGFDRMFPDYTIDKELGGEKAFQQLVEKATSLGLQTSHHYNPRIADINWMQSFPKYREAIVQKDGMEVLEPYKNHMHYVMNLNEPLWFERCFETVNYLAGLGLDYLEIDQFTYQRNFFDERQPLAHGYKKMVERFTELGIKFWLEGVSDIFRLSEGNFYQILIRDRAELWGDGENRRGYPYGRTFAEFFMYLYPDSEVSYQVFTENKLFDKIRERVNMGQIINSAIYDIELGFYDENYIRNLKRIIRILNKNE